MSCFSLAPFSPANRRPPRAVLGRAPRQQTQGRHRDSRSLGSGVGSITRKCANLPGSRLPRRGATPSTSALPMVCSRSTCYRLSDTGSRFHTCHGSRRGPSALFRIVVGAGLAINAHAHPDARLSNRAGISATPEASQVPSIADSRTSPRLLARSPPG